MSKRPHGYRRDRWAAMPQQGTTGPFFVGPISGRELWCIASDDYGWEHVSVHSSNRAGKLFMPTWEEMCWIKHQFWDAEDWVMQLHPAKSEYINTHGKTLHLWRPIGQAIPTPPSILVGIKGPQLVP